MHDLLKFLSEKKNCAYTRFSSVQFWWVKLCWFLSFIVTVWQEVSLCCSYRATMWIAHCCFFVFLKQIYYLPFSSKLNSKKCKKRSSMYLNCEIVFLFLPPDTPPLVLRGLLLCKHNSQTLTAAVPSQFFLNLPEAIKQTYLHLPAIFKQKYHWNGGTCSRTLVIKSLSLSC